MALIRTLTVSTIALERKKNSAVFGRLQEFQLGNLTRGGGGGVGGCCSSFLDEKFDDRFNLFHRNG